MFNSPILDVTIGLVFVFLLYSLLVTSVNEAIASTFALRARMLKNAIAERMLSDVSKDGRWTSIWNGFVLFWSETAKIIFGSWGEDKKQRKLGDKFYDHPMIKNYSSSRIYSMPSYIPKNNFSAVLVDVLKQEFDQRKNEIASYKLNLAGPDETHDTILRQLEFSPDLVKVKEVIDYYGRHFADPQLSFANPIIDREAWEVLRMHLNNSGYSFDKFIGQIELWFEDTMGRVSGWYKRQTQFILFVLGFLIAAMFNVDTIALSNKLSTNTDARKILVEEAINFQKKYSDTPQAAPSPTPAQELPPPMPDDTADLEKLKRDSISLAKYQQKIDSLLKFKKNEIDRINEIIGIGWGDYGMKRDSARVLAAYFQKCNCKEEVDGTKRQAILEELYRKGWLRYKASYVICESFQGRRLIGLLLTAFAISLGAPFWFDMLSKLIRVRGAGTKEDGVSVSTVRTIQAGAGTPVIIQNHLTEEAQG